MNSRKDRRGFVAKVSDFGLAQYCPASQGVVENAPWGTLVFMAPERFRTNRLEPASDIWSFGVLMVRKGVEPSAGPSYTATPPRTCSSSPAVNLPVASQWQMYTARSPYEGCKPAQLVHGVTRGTLSLMWPPGERWPPRPCSTSPSLPNAAAHCP